MDRVKKKLHFIILRKIRGPAIHTFFLMEILSSNKCLVGSSAGLVCLRLAGFYLSRFDGPVVSVVISVSLITPGIVLDLWRFPLSARKDDLRVGLEGNDNIYYFQSQYHKINIRNLHYCTNRKPTNQIS